MDFYEFMEMCRETEIPPQDAIAEWQKMEARRRERFIEDYENDPYVQAGWTQQDLIDLHYLER